MVHVNSNDLQTKVKDVMLIPIDATSYALGRTV